MTGYGWPGQDPPATDVILPNGPRYAVRTTVYMTDINFPIVSTPASHISALTACAVSTAIRGHVIYAPPRQPAFRRSAAHLANVGIAVIGRRTKMIQIFKASPITAAAIGVSMLAPALLGMGHAYAQEKSVKDRVLITTAIKTNNTAVHFGAPTPAFTSTKVRCPSAFNHCTMRVEVSSQFVNIQTPDVAGAVVTIDNSQDGVLPSAVVTLDTATTPPGAATVRTFSWMKEGLDSGQHTVDVSFFNSNRSADAVNRTLTIELYN
jgi:hypothetical protein